MLHTMIDLETLSLRPMGMILTMGACLFDEQGVCGQLYHRIKFECDPHPLKIDTATEQWWAEQNKTAYDEAFNMMPRISLKHGLIELARFVRQANYVWSHGAAFDIARLEVLYDHYHLPTPWHHRSPRDTRTLFMMFPPPSIEPTIPHHALYDAIAQAERVRHILAKHTWA